MAVIFSFPEYRSFGTKLEKQTGFVQGNFLMRSFPDGESLIKIQTDVKAKDVILVCGLDNANVKSMPLLFFVATARELGAKSIGLITPYLGYMRQDNRFNPGEAVSSKIFATFLSSLVDWLITLDPHVHRYASLNDIYTIPTTTLHATTLIGDWIRENIEKPLIIGPDEESEQWAKAVATRVDVPYKVLKKIRRGDREVEITVSDMSGYEDYVPVLVDDIISTARTMIEVVKSLHATGMRPPVCIGVHAIFAGDAYEDLKNSGAAKIVTTNAITHETNQIDVTPLFAEVLKS